MDLRVTQSDQLVRDADKRSFELKIELKRFKEKCHDYETELE